MRRRLVMSMMRRMRDRLRIDKPAEDQQTDRQTCGEPMAKRSAHGYGSDADCEERCASRSTI